VTTVKSTGDAKVYTAFLPSLDKVLGLRLDTMEEDAPADVRHL
jgi:hypothetical protein